MVDLIVYKQLIKQNNKYIIQWIENLHHTKKILQGRVSLI